MGSGLEERKIAAIVGALVGDAAAVPLHWVYKVDELDKVLAGAKDVAFWEPAMCPFYRVPLGSLSCFGDQTLVILQSLVDSKGLNPEALKKTTYECLGPKSDYEKNRKNAVQKKPDEPEQSTPIEGPWRHHSVKAFLQNIMDGKEATGHETDKSNDCCMRIIPAVALYAGQDCMLEKAESVIRQTQNNDMAVAGGLAAARFLEYYILNGRRDDGVEHVIKELSNEKRQNPKELDKDFITYFQDVLSKKNVGCIEGGRKYKLNCPMPDSLQSSVHGVIASEDYSSGVEGHIKVGGDSCGRCGYIGACLAAQHGLSSIPETWKQKTLRYQEILKLAQQLVKGN